jgi:hypothetical protein
MKKDYYKSKLSFLALVAFFLLPGLSVNAEIFPFHNTYTGAQEVPPNGSPGKGTIVGTYNDVTNTISYTIIFSGLVSPTVAAHFHAPAPPGVNAPVIIGHAGFPLGVTSGKYSNTHVITDVQEAQLFSSLWYSNIHTSMFPGGEIRAQIVLGDPSTTFTFNNTYSGSQEVPPNASPGTGTIIGSYNHVTNTISYAIIFSGLLSPTVAAHFHAPAPPGVNAPVIIGHAGFPLGVSSGTYSNTHVISDLQEFQLFSGLWYSNIHTSMFPGGEIRTQIILTPPCAPPVISNLSASPNSLWPPNHKMRDVVVNYTTTSNCPGPVSCNLTVTSNEPVNGNGDGNTAPDWTVTDDHRVKLRAERSGNGSGRIYTITVTCTGPFGNVSTNSTTVTVPHDMGRSIQSGASLSEIENNGGDLAFKIAPNPGYSYFTLNIQTSNNADRISVRISDLAGRLVDSRKDLTGSQTIRIGEQLKAGVYILQLRQGNKTEQIKLIKLK